MKAGEPLELLMPDGEVIPFVLQEMQDEEGNAIDCAPHAQQKFTAYSEKRTVAVQFIEKKRL